MATAAPISEPLAGDLWIFYAIDLPDRLQYLTGGQLAAIGVERGELRALAIENLGRLISGVVRIEGNDDLGVYAIYGDGTYESSFLLLDAFWAATSEQLGAPPVIGVPSRDIVLFARSDDPEATAARRRITEELEAEAGYAISRQLYVRGETGWAVKR